MTSTTSSGGPPVLPGDLPSSAPLPGTQLVVPMRGDDGDWNLYLADTARPGPVRQLTTARTSENLPVLSPRRDTVIYLAKDGDSSDRSTLRVMAADGTGDRELFALPSGCDRVLRPAWDPADPSRLAVPCVSDDGRYRLRFVRTDGQLLGDVTAPNGKPRMDDPSFSPDGRLLGFWASAEGSWDGGTLYVVPVAGGRPRPLLAATKNSVDGQDADLVFSPDGRYVAFRRRLPTAQPQGQFDVFRANADGTHLVRLTDNESASEQDPTWSPDSTRLAIKSDASSADWVGRRNTRVWIIYADGRRRQQVLWTSPDTDRAQSVPSWSAR